MNFGYEYFCGANVVVEIESMPILECSGLRVSIMESKRPIYGYSSRHYDAVASGQVLVEGALLINYVHQNYLFEAIRLGLESTGQVRSPKAPSVLDTSGELFHQLSDEVQAQRLMEEYARDPVNNQDIAQAAKDKIYRAGQTLSLTPIAIPKPNPHDVYGGLDIRVTFGDKQVYNFGSGITSYVIQNVHILGRGHTIAIDESVIVEEYPFFARNIVHLPNPYVLSFQQDGPTALPGEETASISRATVENR